MSSKTRLKEKEEALASSLPFRGRSQMASGTQQHQYQQQHQQQKPQELPISQRQEIQMQFVSNQGLDSCFDPQQQMHQLNTMSPVASAPMSIDQSHAHMVTMSSHQPQSNQMINSLINTTSMNQDLCNQATQQHLMQPQQQQKSQLLPLLLSPAPTSLKTPDHSDQPESDHDQIIDQVISLENDYSDPSGAIANVDNLGMVMTQQSQHRLMSDRPNLTNSQCVNDGNQLSNSSEDLLNILLEMDRDSSTGGNHQLDQDEKVGIETIRKQLMGCEVQLDQMIQQNTNSMSPILNQYSSSHVSHQAGTAHQPHLMAHVQQQQQQQLIPQTAPVISPHQQQSQHQISTSQRQQQPPQHHRLSVDQTLLHGPYSNSHLGSVPVSSSGQSYTSQPHLNISRISQSTPMSIDNNSPSPSWQQPQLSPFSPPTQHNDPTRPPSQHRQHAVMQHSATTSPQIQQLHNSLQRRSPSQSISPPATTEPSPVVKKNPLLNAQLVNSRNPLITPSRFMNSQSVLNQNPILNSKLSQGTYVTSSCSTVGSPVNAGLNSQPRFISEQQTRQQQSNFNYDITQQQNAQQHATQTGYMSMYSHGDHQQQQQPTNQMFRTSTVTTTASSCVPQTGVPHMTMGSTSPSGGLSQQVKQEIRKKVQQPKQQHQTTSLLKQLLSDDNK